MHSVTIKSDKPLVVIPAEEYESMKQAIELLSANPNLLKELEEERRNVAEGKSTTWTEFKKKYKVR